MFKASMDELYAVLKDFHKLTNFLIVVFDADRKCVASYPDRMCEFCKEVRKSRELARKCIECDNIGFDVCDKTGKPYIYKCHMSVIEAISPIRFNETSVGYLMFGQILCENHADVYEKAKTVSALYSLDINERMINEMTVADDETISSAVNMMTMCACYLYTNEIIRKSPDILADRLKKHVSENVSGDLSVESVCTHFYVSRTKLYQLSTSAFIAELVGISDSNYFIRLFKKQEGVTPLAYRKNLSE